MAPVRVHVPVVGGIGDKDLSYLIFIAFDTIVLKTDHLSDLVCQCLFRRLFSLTFSNAKAPNIFRRETTGMAFGAALGVSIVLSLSWMVGLSW